MFEFVGKNNTEICGPNARSSQMQPAEPLLAHMLVKPLYSPVAYALNDSVQVGEGMEEPAKSNNSTFLGTLKPPL